MREDQGGRWGDEGGEGEGKARMAGTGGEVREGGFVVEDPRFQGGESHGLPFVQHILMGSVQSTMELGHRYFGIKPPRPAGNAMMDMLSGMFGGGGAPGGGAPAITGR